MKAVIRTWGNSLAVRIPKTFAVSLGIDEGKEVELLLEPKGMRILRADRDLDVLLQRVTAGNMHGETDTGTAIGKELW